MNILFAILSYAAIMALLITVVEFLRGKIKEDPFYIGEQQDRQELQEARSKFNPIVIEIDETLPPIQKSYFKSESTNAFLFNTKTRRFHGTRNF